jgi:hypothetical protein
MYLFRLTLKPTRSLEKTLFRNTCTSLTSTLQWWQCHLWYTWYLRHGAVEAHCRLAGHSTNICGWYGRSIWRRQRGRCCTKGIILVLWWADRWRPCTARCRRYHVGPKWLCQHRWVMVNEIYIFWNKDFFLDGCWILSPKPSVWIMIASYGAGLGWRVFTSNWRVSKYLERLKRVDVILHCRSQALTSKSEI